MKFGIQFFAEPEPTPTEPTPPTPTQEPVSPPLPTLADLLAGNADYTAQYQSMLNEAKEQWEAESNARMNEIRVDWELTAGLKQAGARNEKAVLALIDRSKIKVTEEGVQGVAEQLEALRESDPYLFEDNGGKPYFSTGSGGGNPESKEAAVVAARYKNNPFYHG
jgi:hypothetical protein